MKANRQLVFDKMVEYIAKGVFRPHEKIYSENRLARILGVGRNDVHEAMMALELMGVVKNFQGKGTYLVPFELDKAANPFALMLMLSKGNPDDIMAVRRLLEPEVTRLCAELCEERTVENLHRCLQAMHGAGRPERYAREDANFHSIIADGCGNPLLRTLMHIVFGYISYVSLNNWFTLVQPEHDDHKQRILTQHSELFTSIANRAPERAFSSSKAHLDYIECNLNQTIKLEYSEHEKQKSLSWP